MTYIKKIVRASIVIILLNIVLSRGELKAQDNMMMPSQQFQFAERIIRIAEQGQLADTVSVWGDVGSPGVYMVPKGTTVPELLSYCFGPITLRDQNTNIDWSKMRVEISINDLYGVQGHIFYKYEFDKPLSEELRDYEVKNNQLVTLRVKRKPAIADFLRVIGPTITAVTGTIIIFDRLRNR